MKLTYILFLVDNISTQKTVSANVENGSNCFNQFEEIVRNRFSNEKCEIRFNHVGKVITLDYSPVWKRS